MNFLRLLRLVPLALVALFAVSSPLGRAEGTVPPPASNVISIDFAGGPLSELVTKLNTNKDAKLSIIQSAGLDPVLPAFSVRNVHIVEVIAALGRIVEPQGYQLSPTGPNLAVLSKYERVRAPAFASFQLEGKIGPAPGQATAEDIVAAIQQGCEFANEGKPSTLRFKYHPATKLLFVAGTDQEVDVAHRVFGSLPNSAPAKESLPANKK